MMGESDVKAPNGPTIADAIIELTADRVVFDPQVLDEAIEASESETLRPSAAGIVKTAFPVKYSDYAEGRYDR